MRAPAASPADLRQALGALAMAAGGLLAVRNGITRAAVTAGLKEANQALRAPDGAPDVVSPRGPSGLPAPDPEALIQAYLDGGGEWRDLVAAVSRERIVKGREQ